MPHLDEKVNISDADIVKALERPRDFGYSGDRREEMFRTWSLGPIVLTRDSRLLDQANHKALIAYLETDPSLADDWEITGCNHWACGWVDHLSFRVVDPDGAPSRIFRVLTAWFGALESYPVADDSLYSEMEYEATLKNIAEAGRRFLKEGAPEGWAGDAARWFDDNGMSRALESRDDQGGYPNDDEIKAALAGLGLLDEEA